MPAQTYPLVQAPPDKFMNRERALQILLVFLGLGFVVLLYPLATSLLHPQNNDLSAADQMLATIYFTLGVFLLSAVRQPSGHRSLIAFAGWSSFAHVSVMVAQALQGRSQGENLPPLIFAAGVCLVLIVLTPAKRSADGAPA